MSRACDLAVRGRADVFALSQTLAFRLVLALTVFMAAMRVVFGYVETRRLEGLVLEQIVNGAEELSRSIVGATWHAMLADDREATFRIMRAISEEHGVECVRMVNPRGEVTFTTPLGVPGADPAETTEDELARCTCPVDTILALVERPVRRTRVVEVDRRNRILETLTPIHNEPSCWQASCHAHESTEDVLGVLVIDLDLDQADRELASIVRAGWIRTLVEIALMGVIIVLITRWLVGTPLQKLLEGIHAGSRMEFDRPVRVRGHGELRVVADSFDSMRVRLRDAMHELHEFNEGLERLVEERSRELNATQHRLIQSERLASLGQLAASMAHEINNPVSGVLNYTMVIERMLDDEESLPANLPRIRRFLETMEHETERVGRIVSDLLAFSRRARPGCAQLELAEVVDRVMSLVGHRLELGKVRTKVEIADGLPPLFADAGQLEQVLVNLVMNAAEAQPEGGTVRVRARADGEYVVLEVHDDGSGIEAAHLERVFDPFFTTKDESKGVGLGLSVVYGIVEEHGGTIEVESELGRGTCFRVRLPVHGPLRDRSGKGAVVSGVPS